MCSSDRSLNAKVLPGPMPILASFARIALSLGVSGTNCRAASRYWKKLSLIPAVVAGRNSIFGAAGGVPAGGVAAGGLAAAAGQRAVRRSVVPDGHGLFVLEVDQHALACAPGRAGLGGQHGRAPRLAVQVGAEAAGQQAQAQRAREDMAGIRGSLAGRVAIGLPTSVARAIAVPLTRALRAQMPDATFSISEGLSASLLDGLTAGRLDVVALYNAQPVPEIELRAFGEEELFLVSLRAAGSERRAPPDPLPLAKLPEFPLVIPSRPNAIRMHVESALANIGARPNIALEIDGVPAILDLVADGAGHALLSAQAVSSASRPDAYQMRQAVEGLAETPLSAVVSSLPLFTRPLPQRLKLLDDCLSAVDTNTESQIIGYLNDALAGKTAIIITHRIYGMLVPVVTILTLYLQKAAYRDAATKVSSGVYRAVLTVNFVLLAIAGVYMAAMHLQAREGGTA